MSTANDERHRGSARTPAEWQAERAAALAAGDSARAAQAEATLARIDRACRAFAETVVAGRRRRDSLTVEEAAREAWHPCHRLTLAELEDKIRAGREEREAAPVGAA